MVASNDDKVHSHHDATRLHEEHAVDITAHPVPLYICIDADVVAAR